MEKKKKKTKCTAKKFFEKEMKKAYNVNGKTDDEVGQSSFGFKPTTDEASVDTTVMKSYMEGLERRKKKTGEERVPQIRMAGNKIQLNFMPAEKLKEFSKTHRRVALQPPEEMTYIPEMINIGGVTVRYNIIKGDDGRLYAAYILDSFGQRFELRVEFKFQSYFVGGYLNNTPISYGMCSSEEEMLNLIYDNTLDLNEEYYQWRNSIDKKN